MSILRKLEKMCVFAHTFLSSVLQPGFKTTTSTYMDVNKKLALPANEIDNRPRVVT